MNAKIVVRLMFVLAAVGVVGMLPVYGQPDAQPKFNVKIADDKEVVVNLEDSGAVDPTRRINFSSQGQGFYIQVNTIRNETLHLSHFPSFMINGRFHQQAQGGRFENINQPLKAAAGGKPRVGSSSTWVIENLHITQTLELHPSKSKGPGQKRLSNNVLISYSIENKGMNAATVGVRTYMDTYVIDNDGCLFAAPVTHPNKILDGVTLQEKTLPPYVQMLRFPNLQNPGFMSYLTLNVGSRYEKANKLVLTQHGQGFGGWEMAAVPSMGDSGIGLYWPVKDLKPGGKRDVAYVYGEGIAITAEAEGRYQMSLAGSFEPGRVATVSALIADPALGQTLSLELPKGMERVEGKEIQPVSPLSEGDEYSTVLWKVRVNGTGTYPIRIRSSTGVTQTKIVTVSAER